MPNAKHLFVLDPGILGTATKDDIEATARGLAEVGLYQMPYDRDVYMEISAIECVGTDADPNHTVIYGPFGSNQNVQTAVRDIKRGVLTEFIAWNEPGTPESIVDLKNVLIVLLATKNAVKRTTENKLAKLDIGKSAKNRFAFTTSISLPSDLPNDTENPPKGGKVAPHLRRGHVRRQHYGAGNQMEKKIWIAPVFVNADPDFVATRQKYRIGGFSLKAA